ncbi:hypothetical protein QJR26_10270 [Clostridium baratii]
MISCLDIISLVLIIIVFLLIFNCAYNMLFYRSSNNLIIKIVLIFTLMSISSVNIIFIKPYILFNTKIGLNDVQDRANKYLLNTYKDGVAKIINIDGKGNLKFEVELSNDKKIEKEIPYSIYENGGEISDQSSIWIIPFPFRF